MIRYYVVPNAEKIVNPEPEFLHQYVSVRPDVLGVETQDIFAPNSRSERQRWKDFGLFERVEQWMDADVIVCQHWFDIAMACGRRVNIDKLAERVISDHPGKVVVFSWNHDTDGAFMPELRKFPKNVVVLQYNTSKPCTNDLLLPFWNVETSTPIDRKRTIRAGFRGHIGGIRCRKDLLIHCDGKAGITVSDSRMKPEHFYEWMCSLEFALCPRGGGLSSYRFYEAIQCEAIPVLFADAAVLPYPTMDYGRFSIRISESAANDVGVVHEAMVTVDADAMREDLRRVRPQFGLLGVQQAVAAAIQERMQCGS